MSESARNFSGAHLAPPLHPLERGSSYLWSHYASIVMFAGGMMLLAQSASLFSELRTLDVPRVAETSKEAVANIETPVVVPHPSTTAGIDPIHLGLANRLNLRFGDSRLLGDFNAKALPGHVEIQFTYGEVFQTGHATLMPAGEQEILSLAQEVLQVSRHQQVQVEGYTDSRPVVKNSWMYPTNWELSGARAASVLRVFEELGFPPEQLRFVGFGRTRLATADISSAGTPIIANQLLNRRMVIHVGKPAGWQ